MDWTVVWLITGIVTIIVLAAFLAGLVRQVMMIGRAAKQFQEVMAPISQEISRTSERAARLGAERDRRRPLR